MAIDTGGQVTDESADITFIRNRAESLDLGGSFEAPPGDPISHQVGARYLIQWRDKNSKNVPITRRDYPPAWQQIRPF